MNESEIEAVEALKSKIDEIEADYVSELPFSLFEKPTNKTTQLLASNPASGAIDGRNRWFEYKFRDPCLVSRVVIQTSGYSDYHEFEFAWRDEAAKEQRTHGKLQDGTFEFIVNDICSRLAFRPPSTWFSSPKVLSVSVEGVGRENVGLVLDTLSDLQSAKEDILNVADRAIGRADARI